MVQEPPQQTYEVHLTADVTGALGIETPVETDRIDYYDSGIWVGLDAGRDFYPYRHVLSICERPAAGEAETTASGSGVQQKDVSEDIEN